MELDQHTRKIITSKYVTQVQKQRSEWPTVTLIWHACKYKVPKLHQRYILILCGVWIYIPRRWIKTLHQSYSLKLCGLWIYIPRRWIKTLHQSYILKLCGV